jgi:hypothetical protein
MAYIGRRPLIGNYIVLDAISPSATTTFNLTQSGSAYSPQLAQNCIVSVNGVIQAPNTSYTISGSTIVFSTALSTTDTINFITVLGDVQNVGTPTAGTVTAASFATGFNGVVTWQNVQTTNFTAVAGRGYPVNTTSAGITMTLPASATTGATIQVVDYAGTFGTNVVIINPNGNKINGSTSNLQLQNNREGVQLVYVDSTQGWVAALDANSTTNLQPVPYSADFLVIAGGGGGGADGGGGAGAGGYRSSNATYGGSGGGGSAESSLTLTPGTIYTITVGAGGSNGTGSSSGATGSNSSISGTGITTITSSGGGGGGGNSTNGVSGGSGGGAGQEGPTSNGGSGTSNQGYAGGPQDGNNGGGGGGGAGAVGQSAAGTSKAGNGGNGVASTITGSSVTRGGGGGGGFWNSSGPGVGGTGGGGNGSTDNSNTGVTAGTANTGGGGGGGSGGAQSGASGGSGIVILSVPTSKYSGTVTGTYSTSTSGSNTIISFTGSGTYTG